MFLPKNADINKIKEFLVLIGLFFETTNEPPKKPTLIRVNLTLLSFARDDFDYYNPSTESLFEILLLKAKSSKPKGIRKNYMLTTKEDVGSFAADDNSAYIVTASATRQFKVNVNWLEHKVEVHGVHTDSSGEFFFKKRVNRAYETVYVNKDSVYSLSRYYRKSKSFLGLRQLLVRITPVQQGK